MPELPLYEPPAVEITAPTPVPGLGVPRDRLPVNVRTLRGRPLEEPPSAAEAAARLPGVYLNEIQGNAWQPDLGFRGFTASPLLGAPQGLSVYQDGVRLNAPFGDIVSWELIPMVAMDSLTLVPGSNPLFGLNTLGGALALRTKSGDTHAGRRGEVSLGTFGRRALELEAGGAREDGVHGYAAGQWSAEDGWREHSPSEVHQAFAKIGRRSGRDDLSASLTWAATDLVGNGLVPRSFLDRRRDAIFTRPDNTRQRMLMLALSGSRGLGARSELGATFYLRGTRTRTLNGDVNDDFEDEGGAPGVNNRTAARQSAWGGALQWTLAAPGHQLVAGAAYDASGTRFRQSAEAGIFDATRAVLSTETEELENALRASTATRALFVTDTWTLRPQLHLTLAARYNDTRVRLRDTGPSAPALDGSHRFVKLNPAVGLAYQASEALTLYGGLAQASRAPTPIELGCADPARPCTLPNALAADPPLNQVVTRTFEAGVRGTGARSLRWSAGLFESWNRDDILFVGTATSAGYFTNFGRTRRRGVELVLSGGSGGAHWSAAYSQVRASFESSACVVAESNASRGSAVECTGVDLIGVRPGDRIPGVPEHSVKLWLAYAATERLRLAAQLSGFSAQYARGNENNAHGPGGKIAGYGVVNLGAEYRLGARWQLLARVDNVFDRRYATAAALAENPFAADGPFLADADQWTRETFHAPGAPRAAWIGVRYASE